jgi:hypothetical protein
MSGQATQSYELWLAELVQVAKQQELQWLVSPGTATHRLAFDNGLTPHEELTALKDMSEWRGCGCGGA